VAPIEEPVTVAEVKLYTRVYHDVEDALIAQWIKSGRKAAEDYQHRSYVTQTWVMNLDSFPCSQILLPRPPLVSVESIKYYDTDNVEYTVDAATYYVDSSSEVGRLSLNYGISWPTITLRPINAVKITFVTGYGAPEDVPDQFKDAIYLYCAYRFENRIAESGTIPRAFFDILRPDRMAVY
jgi:uncharacterized phiE125 gp8 family phage protein